MGDVIYNNNLFPAPKLADGKLPEKNEYASNDRSNGLTNGPENRKIETPATPLARRPGAGRLRLAFGIGDTIVQNEKRMSD